MGNASYFYNTVGSGLRISTAHAVVTPANLNTGSDTTETTREWAHCMYPFHLLTPTNPYVSCSQVSNTGSCLTYSVCWTTDFSPLTAHLLHHIREPWMSHFTRNVRERGYSGKYPLLSNNSKSHTRQEGEFIMLAPPLSLVGVLLSVLIVAYSTRIANWWCRTHLGQQIGRFRKRPR